MLCLKLRFFLKKSCLLWNCDKQPYSDEKREGRGGGNDCLFLILSQTNESRICRKEYRSLSIFIHPLQMWFFKNVFYVYLLCIMYYTFFFKLLVFFFIMLEVFWKVKWCFIYTNVKMHMLVSIYIYFFLCKVALFTGFWTCLRHCFSAEEKKIF